MTKEYETREKSDEEKRIEFAEKSAKEARDKELKRREELEAAQKEAAKHTGHGVFSS